MKTYSPKPEHIERRWYVVDASGHVLGRLASEVATLLRGKHKPMFAPHMNTGDHVIVINADKIELTGNKGEDKYAYRHSGYPGGIKAVKYKDLMADRPVAAVEKAVKGMLPKNSLGRQMIKKLHVVAGAEHPHKAQSPVTLAVGERPAWDGLPVASPKAPTAPKPSRPKTTTDDAEEREAKPAAKPKATKPADTAEATPKPKRKATTARTTKPKAATKTKTAEPKAAKPKARPKAKAAAKKPKTEE
jgi:large subunit ribosomal protein L13